MADLNLSTLADALNEMIDNEVLSIKPTKMFLWGLWTEEERAAALELVEEARNESS